LSAPATAVSVRPVVASASALATAIAVRFPALARLALISAFAGWGTFVGWGAFGRRAAHCLVSLGHGCPAGEPHTALFVHTQALDPDLIA
jgi:hypothetical protein